MSRDHLDLRRWETWLGPAVFLPLFIVATAYAESDPYLAVIVATISGIALERLTMWANDELEQKGDRRDLLDEWGDDDAT